MKEFSGIYTIGLIESLEIIQARTQPPEVMTYVYVRIYTYIYTYISSHAHLQIDPIEARAKYIATISIFFFPTREMVFVLINCFNFKFRLINIVEIYIYS